jgi:hypothetical protein
MSQANLRVYPASHAIAAAMRDRVQHTLNIFDVYSLVIQINDADYSTHASAFAVKMLVQSIMTGA